MIRPVLRAPSRAERIRNAYLAFETALDLRLREGWAGLRRAGPPAAAGLRRARRVYLAAEARLDRGIAAVARPIAFAAEGYERLLHRLRVRGWTRGATEIASEAASLAAFGLLTMLIFAVPAFRETQGDWLKRLQLSVTFLDRDGHPLGHRGIRHDDTVTLDRLPPHLVQAVIATEDKRFYDHLGIDPIGLVRAIGANARAAGIVQGGSTLSQQLAKNLFLTNERSYERKIREAYLAIWLEAHFTKDQILQLYLDRVYMGAGIFGIGAASQYYFDKPAQALDLPEAAMLAGLFKAPTRLAPHANLAAAQARAADVLRHMRDARYLTEAEAEAAAAHPAVPVERQPEAHPDYYLDWAYREVERLAAAGRLGPDTVLTVRTPLDRTIQAAAETTLDSMLTREGARYKAGQGAIVTLAPDGALRAMVGGRDYGESQFNRATEARRQPGSAFKPFVYAAALAYAGYRPESVLTDSEVCIGRWCPQNYGRGHAGAVPLWLALARSINTIPVKLSIGIGRALIDPEDALRRGGLRTGHLAQVGRARIVELAHRMGLKTPLPDSASLPIGSAETTVLDMGAAYAVFANGGREAPPYAADSIVNSRGQVLYTQARNAARRVPVLPAATVAAMNGMLARVPEQGTGRRAALPGLRSAGKTGTTNGYRDAWYVGYTGDFVTAVWFGNDDYAGMRQMTGGTLPAMAWRSVMMAAERGSLRRPIPGLDAPIAEAAPGGFVELVPAIIRENVRDVRPRTGFAPVDNSRGRFAIGF